MKKVSVKLMSYATAFVMSVVGSSIALKTSDAYAESFTPSKKVVVTQEPKEGAFLADDMYEESQYHRYVAKEGDNLSRVSEKVCKYFGEEISTKYWPTLAFLNGYPRVMNPGDIIIFPGTFEDMEEMNAELRRVGWTARYIQANDVYGTRKEATGGITLGELLIDIYGKKACVDPDFVARYLRTIGVRGDYSFDYVIKDTNTYFKFTEWIPTLEELGIKKQKQVKKSK